MKISYVDNNYDQDILYVDNMTMVQTRHAALAPVNAHILQVCSVGAR